MTRRKQSPSLDAVGMELHHLFLLLFSSYLLMVLEVLLSYLVAIGYLNHVSSGN